MIFQCVAHESHSFVLEIFLLQSNLDYPDLDYPDYSIIRTFFSGPNFS